MIGKRFVWGAQGDVRHPSVAWLVEFRPAAPAVRAPGVVTRLEATGFRPLPDGIALVEEIKP
jgi:hypothetical protein